MASWPPLSQKINYLLACQSIVWYLLREITISILPIITGIGGIGTDTDTDTGIGPSLIMKQHKLPWIGNLRNAQKFDLK